jgi:hypothetical protein
MTHSNGGAVNAGGRINRDDEMHLTLTEKQERFCAFYVECGNASEAYRRAYEPPTATDKSIREKASRLLAQDNIAARIEQLRAPVREKAQLTLETHLEKLASLRDKAEERENFPAAITAEVSRGKAAGLYVERAELTGKNGTPLNPASLTPEEREREVMLLIRTWNNRKKLAAS